MRQPSERQTGRVYRRTGYGPLLDVFMLDMRSYRDNTWNKRDDNSDTFILGPAQLAWLKRELVASNATWKVIAADMSIGLISEDAVALGDGPPDRREHEIADLLSFMKRAGIRNTVWLTADMHYTAAHHYDPNRAAYQDLEPFWEFVSGPLHAGTWSPGDLDNTFGPKAVFQKGCSAEQGDNLAPNYGTTSSAYTPSFQAAAAFWCDDAANSSCWARVNWSTSLRCLGERPHRLVGEYVVKTVVGHAVEHGDVAVLVSGTAVHQQVRRLRHGFLPAGDDDVELTGADQLIGQRDRVDAGQHILSMSGMARPSRSRRPPRPGERASARPRRSAPGP